MQENLRSTPGLGRSSGEGNGNPLQYCCRGNLMHRGAWWDTVQGVTSVIRNLVTKLLLLVCVCVCVCMYLGEGNGNPLQYSCLENPRDRGAWRAAVDGVAQSRTRLKQLSSSSSRYGSSLFLPLISHLTLSLLHQFSLTGSPKCP